jgi:hypothetical protein
MKPGEPDDVIAHAELLRAVDKMLSDADEVRRKREALFGPIQAREESRRAKRGKRGEQNA